MTNKTYRLIKQPGLDLIKDHEKLRLRAYLCPANRLTIGYGHVLLPKYDVLMFKGMTVPLLNRLIYDCQRLRKVTREAKDALFISPLQADALLNGDTRQLVSYLNSVVHTELNQNQFDALCSLVFNIGQGNFAGSTLSRRLNDGDLTAAAEEFGKWIYGTVNGKKQKLNGLIFRRAAECVLFETPSTHSGQATSTHSGQAL